MIRRQVVVPAPPADVWEFVTTPETSGPWLGGRLSWNIAEGSELSFEGDDGEIRKGVVEVVRSGRYLQYRWWPEASEAAAEGQGAPDPDSGHPATQVGFILEPDAGDTRLTVVEKPVPESDPIFEPMGPSASIAGAARGSAGGPVPAARLVPPTDLVRLVPVADCGSVVHVHGLVPPTDLDHVADLDPLAVLRSTTSWTATDDLQLRAWAECLLGSSAR